MSQQGPHLSSSTWGKLGLGVGALVCVLPLLLFGLGGGKLPTLPALQQCVLTAVFIASLVSCSLVASWRPMIGLLALPPVFFGLMCLACWWVVAR
jgi:hypothetical protein